jgi:hypothetical protein
MNESANFTSELDGGKVFGSASFDLIPEETSV